MTTSAVDLERLETLERTPPADRLDWLRTLGPPAECLTTLAEAAARLTHADPDRALTATLLVTQLADAAGVAVAQVRSRRAHARALAYAGRYDASLDTCLEAIEIAAAAGVPVEGARVRLASMHALGELGRHDEAIAAGERAREIFLAADAPALAARADINLGIVHQRRDRPRAALDCFARARPLLERDALMLGHLENSRGEALKELNDFTGAEGAYQAALDAFEQAGQDVTAAIAEGNLADLAAREGRLQTALERFERAGRRFDASSAPGHRARLRAEQADAESVLGLPGEAVRSYRAALVELDLHGLALEAARARSGMGLALLRLERTADAETALAAAATAFEELGHASERAKVDVLRAEIALRHGRSAEARSLATRALAALHDRPADAARTRHVLARAAVLAGDDQTAEAELAAALAAARRFEVAPMLADILHTRGALRRRLGRMDAAVNDLSDAVNHVERSRGALQAERYRTAWLGVRSSAHADLIAALLDRDDRSAVADAFDVAEQARSRSLLDQVRSGIDESDAGADDPVVAGLHADHARRRRELNVLYSRLADDGRTGVSAAAGDRWRDAVRSLERELDELESRIASARGTRWLEERPPPVAGLRSRLEPGHAVLSYVVEDDALTAFTIDADGARAWRGLCGMNEVERRLERLQFQIDRALRPGAATARRAARGLDDARHELQALDDLLLGPLRAAVADHARLSIVPSGPLHVLPFHALHDGERHLVEAHEVHTVPSAALLSHLLERTPRVRRDPDAGPLVVGVADDVAPSIELEARAVAARLGCAERDLLLGPAATVAAVRDRASRACLVHLACHGRFLRDHPGGSGLRMADRWLTARDACTLDLDADLVTLSGCETGLSLVGAGDELSGLLRSFFVAGAGSVLVSLWRVDDETTEDFMRRLYGERHTGDGDTQVPGARRVRAAQLEQLAERPHPAFWAPFTLVGRP